MPEAVLNVSAEVDPVSDEQLIESLLGLLTMPSPIADCVLNLPYSITISS